MPPLKKEAAFYVYDLWLGWLILALQVAQQVEHSVKPY